MIELVGKIFAVVGGDDEAFARGIGAVVERAGARVVYVKDADSAKMREEIGALGSVDGAILVPGWYRFGKLMETDGADWDAALTQNFEQMVFAAQAIAKQMIVQGRGGRIVFVSSVASVMPFVETSAVGASLAALTGVAKMAAVDLGAHGITVNVVAAGWVESAAYQPYLSDAGRAEIVPDIPARRIGTAADVGSACAFLLSDAAAYVTGAVVPVDGGYTLTRGERSSPYPAT